jgi:hypothetical protein
MSRVSMAALVMVALASGGTVARADDATAQPAARPRWHLDLRAGWGRSWTTGQSYLGLGIGLAGGVTLRVPFHFEVGAVYHGGSTVSAENATIEYWSRNSSVLAHAAAGYDWNFDEGVVVRPQLIVGGVLISDSMRLGEVTREGLQALFVGGFGFVALADFDDFHVGVDMRALSVPARIASPIGGMYLLFGWEH